MEHAPDAFDPTPPKLVETGEALEALAARAARAPVVALDVEANSLHAYRERACVLQATVGEENAIVDLLRVSDLSPLARALDREDVEVVFHGGDYDIALLSREHAFGFRRVFDTMIAAMLLGEEKIGLANLVLDHFGVELDKRFQKADWGKRPLTPEHIDYLYRDTAYLPGLRDHLLARLVDADLVEEAEIEFRRLAGRRGTVPTFDPEGWRSLKGAQRLDAEGRAVLQRLWIWRDGEAERLDRPPFKVFPPRLMVDLAAAPPRRLRTADDLRGVPAGLRRRYGRAVLEALREAREDARAERAPAPDERPRLTGEERDRRRVIRAREDALRAWRRKEAARREVPNMVVLPNRALGEIARDVPESTGALATDPDVGAKRASRYGETILEIVRAIRTVDDIA